MTAVKLSKLHKILIFPRLNADVSDNLVNIIHYWDILRVCRNDFVYISFKNIYVFAILHLCVPLKSQKRKCLSTLDALFQFQFQFQLPPFISICFIAIFYDRVNCWIEITRTGVAFVERLHDRIFHLKMYS